MGRSPHRLHAALRQALLYDSIGGIELDADDPPDYLDLAYLALTIGMTFQVSDTDISQRRIRRTALHHALLSYRCLAGHRLAVPYVAQKHCICGALGDPHPHLRRVA